MKKILFVLLSIVLTTFSFSNALTLDRYLKKGMSGEDVKALQEILVKSDTGFDKSSVTGYYGQATSEAVASLQSKYSIDPVGYVGPKTIRVIKVLSEINQTAQPNKTNNTTQISQSNNIANKNVATVTTINTNNNNLSINSVLTNNTNTTTVINKTNNKQPEIRTKSKEYNKVFNENKDIKTGFVKPSFATSTNGTTRVIVRYKNTPTVDDENKVVSVKGGKKKVYNLVPIISAEVADTDIDKISTDPNVISIEKDEPIKLNSDLEYANTWGVTNTGVKTVHLAGVTGNGVKVAILDTGVDYNHIDISSNYVRGFNFVNGTVDPMDDNGHGTHIAGTVAALSNSVGVIGEAPDAKIYALKVLDATGAGYSSSVISALDWAVANGIQVVNLSFGTATYPGTAMEDAFINAEAKGLVVVASAGNSGTCAGDTDTVMYPARFSTVISVGATDSNNAHACFSSSGPNVELSAPGVNINSIKLGGGDTLYSGTSMAAPHVTGIAADIISAGVTDLNGNGRTNDEVRDILDKTALDLGTTGRDNIFGFGLAKVDSAIAYLNSLTPVVVTPIVTTTPVIATTTPIITPIIATTTPVIVPIVATTTPIITPIATTTPKITPIVTPPTPVVSPVATTTPITQPIVSPVKTNPIVLPPVISIPKTSDQDVDRQRIENELENIKKGVWGDYKREINSNSNNSNRSEASKGGSGKKGR